MRLSFSLKDNLACEKICAAVQKLVNSYNTRGELHQDKSYLVIDIMNVAYDIDGDLPKIEYKNESINSPT
jgi:hypothetical protein